MPNPTYAADGFRRFLWGHQWRDAWTHPVKVPVLDLRSYAGGLMPLRSESGLVSRVLFLRGADGGRYAFQSVQRNLDSFLPSSLRQSTAQDILDFTESKFNAEHPAAPLVVDGLEEAVGVLGTEGQLYVLRDDSLLGRYRGEFGGVLGVFLEKPDPRSGNRTNLVDAARLVDTKELYGLLQASPKDRVDSRAFLTARFIDVFVNDWAQPPSQWRWGLSVHETDSGWFPVPVNHDEAFAKLDGLFPSNAWHFNPELVGFREKYPSMVGLHFTAQDLDRRFLIDLERPVWDSIAASVAGRLSDEVIDKAVRRMPPEMYELDGEEIAGVLEQRRAALPEAAATLYKLLARTVDIRATDVPEEVRISEVDGLVEVTITERSEDAAVYFRRRFDPRETREIRIRMHGGDDRAVVRGGERLTTTVRVIGGKGDDELEYLTPTRGVRFYDQFGDNRIIGSPGGSRKIDARPYEEWVYEGNDELPRRNWGSWTVPTAKFRISSDFGALVQLGAKNHRYGFRRDPYRRRLSASGGVSTQLKIVLELDGDIRGENSSLHYGVNAFVSQLDVLNYFGEGNDTQNTEPDEFYDVEATLFDVAPRIGRTLSSRFATSFAVPLLTPIIPPTIDVSFNALFDYHVEGDNSGTFIATQPDLYGRGNFGQTGVFLRFWLDSRDFRPAATNGATLSFVGSLFPPLVDVVSTYGSVDLIGTTYFTPPILGRPTLALRVGSKKLWGPFPWFESAFIGGSDSLRGWDKNRFAGDLSLYANAEIRARLTRTRRVLPGSLGFYTVTDVGRVYVDGESPGGLHWGYGLGLWFSFLSNNNTVQGAAVNSTEGLQFYFDFGFFY